MNWVTRFREEFFPRQDAFDKTHGTRTAGIISLSRLHIKSDRKTSGVRYQPCDENLFKAAITGVCRDLPFVDVGCGKGRVLFMAKEAGFAQVSGVEFSLKLAQIARANCPFASVVVADAAEYEFPNHPVCAFLFNPFGPEVLTDVLRRLPSNTIIVYVNPLHWLTVSRIRPCRIVRNESGLFTVAQVVP